MPGWPFHFCSLWFASLFTAYRVWKTGVAFSVALVLWKGHLRFLAIISKIYQCLSPNMFQTCINFVYVGLKSEFRT